MVVLPWVAFVYGLRCLTIGVFMVSDPQTLKLRSWAFLAGRPPRHREERGFFPLRADGPRLSCWGRGDLELPKAKPET